MQTTTDPNPQQAAILERQEQGGLRGKILAANDLTSEMVDVPEWDVTVEVRSLTAKRRAELLQHAADNGGKIDLTRIYPDMVIATAFDPESGDQIFTAADRDALSEKSGAAVERIATVAGRLSGMTDASEKAVKND